MIYVETIIMNSGFFLSSFLVCLLTSLICYGELVMCLEEWLHDGNLCYTVLYLYIHLVSLLTHKLFYKIRPMYGIYNTLNLVMVGWLRYMTWSWLGDYGHDLVIMTLPYMITCMVMSWLGGFGTRPGLGWVIMVMAWLGDYGHGWVTVLCHGWVIVMAGRLYGNIPSMFHAESQT